MAWESLSFYSSFLFLLYCRVWMMRHFGIGIFFHIALFRNIHNVSIRFTQNVCQTFLNGCAGRCHRSFCSIDRQVSMCRRCRAHCNGSNIPIQQASTRRPISEAQHHTHIAIAQAPSSRYFRAHIWRTSSGKSHERLALS